MSIELNRVWAMLNSNTFSIKPIRELIDRHLIRTDGISIDPFANSNQLAGITNDLNPEFDTDYCLDAIDFLKIFEDDYVKTVLFDPPYSPRQVSEVYKSLDKTVNMQPTQASFWSNLKKEVSRLVEPGGKVITCGWNSGGIGKKYGFQIVEILLVPHGGWHNDTIVTVEVKRSAQSDLFR